MLTDKELGETALQLAGFRQASVQHQQSLTAVLEKYTTLVDDYRRLKSDYEEERDSRERYKQLARGQERNPFVLVLVDGDGYVFRDDLVSNGIEGGQRAAQVLNDAVKRSMAERGLDHCRIMVRIYANLAGLSKALSRAKLVGADKRSLAPFTASFNRSNDLFDFVDAGELKENADFKIRALFRQFAENAQCRHIYFAGCHDVGYVSELTPYASNRDRITLVKTYDFHPEFAKLGLRTEDFPRVFRPYVLDEQSVSHQGAPLYPADAASPSYSAQATTAPPGNAVAPRICIHFQKGICKYGKNCNKLHVMPSQDDLKDVRDWREKKSNAPYRMPHLAKNDREIMDDYRSGGLDSDGHTKSATQQVNFAVALMRMENIPPAKIPVNHDQHRLDAYIPPPSSEDKAAFRSRINVRKFCNAHYLKGYCPDGDDCAFDHQPITPGVLNSLIQVVRSAPCPHKGACRSLACLNGHICQRTDCRYRGGSAFCKFPPQVHAVDLSTAMLVDGKMPSGGITGGGAALMEEGSMRWYNSTPSIRSEPGVDSDGDIRYERPNFNGALLDMQDDTPLD